MPEMTAMPILPVALAPANPGQGSAGKNALTEKDRLSGTDQATTSSSAGPVQGDGADSFARILQRQLAQVPTQPAAVAAQTFPMLALDPAAQSLLLAELDLDPAAPRLLATAVTLDPAVQPPSEAESGINLVTELSPAPTSLPAPTAKLSDLSASADDDASKESLDDAVASQSPYLLGIASPSVIKLDTDKLNTAQSGSEKGSAGEPESASQLAVASPLLIASHPDDAKNALPTNIAVASQAAASKTADIAAALSAASDTKPTGPNPDSASAESGFDNLLAAAQAFNRDRTAVAHTQNHASTSLPVRTPMGAPGWDGEVSDKLVWMVGRQEQRAELVLNPPQLGRVEVSLSMSGGQTSALFVSANPAVRDALEAALPRLREILADAGVTLSQAQVGADSGSNGAANQSTNHRENGDNSARTHNRLDLANSLESRSTPVAATQWLRQANGLVDVFA